MHIYIYIYIYTSVLISYHCQGTPLYLIVLEWVTWVALDSLFIVGAPATPTETLSLGYLAISQGKTPV